jgi:hypothetical protein
LIRCFLEIVPLRSNDTEALPGRRFHHAPRSDRPDSLRAQAFQPPNLRLDIVGFDIEVNAAGMVDSLYFDLQAVWPGIELTVLFVVRISEWQRPVTQSLSPKLSGLVDVAAFAIHYETC